MKDQGNVIPDVPTAKKVTPKEAEKKTLVGNCAICLEPLAKVKRIVMTLPCGHSYCKKCLATYARNEIKNVTIVECPTPECNVPLKLEGLIGKVHIKESKKIPLSACPITRCRGAMVDGQCNKCGAKKCSTCGEAEHLGTECDPLLVTNHQTIAEETKPCPKCKTPIYKDGGCEHVKCTRCKTDFWFNTLEIWDPRNPGGMIFNNIPAGERRNPDRIREQIRLMARNLGLEADGQDQQIDLLIETLVQRQLEAQ